MLLSFGTGTVIILVSVLNEFRGIFWSCMAKSFGLVDREVELMKAFGLTLLTTRITHTDLLSTDLV